ncbi:MAG: stage IV sporulation protein A [Firmicutes bacterium]|nr:stage IV sporulation protein A [Bacillota bacterium]MDY3658820.1 stage IV sporulation protein A [Eubacteriales bacterium]
MENYGLYEDIAKRTGGDIYVGVVGPVRCGKSTFITQFMQNLVVPNITDKNIKERTIDELPQSADGKTIMTTQPRFIPSKAASIRVGENVDMNVRMIDCVGYLIDGAIGHEEGDRKRLVKTPWSEEEMPFEEAAELGTKKVIDEHSTIGIVLTTDGSISEIPRSSYVEAEERVVRELNEQGKPFVVVLNTKNPKSDEAKKLSKSLEAKYGVPVLAIDVLKLNQNNIDDIFEKILLEFPIKSLKVKMPQWMQALPYNHPIIESVISEIKKFGENANKIGQIDKTNVAFLESEDFEPVVVSSIKMGEGKICFEITPKQGLFYRVLSEQCGIDVSDDFKLISYIKQLAHAKFEYDKIKVALQDVKEKGYGIVMPNAEDMSLEDPEIVKQGSKFGVKLKASAPSLHIMSVDIETEVNPIVGSQAQSEELVKYLMSEFEQNPKAIWETNMFGKSLSSLVNEGINSKITLMPVEAQRKMRKTLGRIINEGKGGIICILL